MQIILFLKTFLNIWIVEMKFDNVYLSLVKRDSYTFILLPFLEVN